MTKPSTTGSTSSLLCSSTVLLVAICTILLRLQCLVPASFHQARATAEASVATGRKLNANRVGSEFSFHQRTSPSIAQHDAGSNLLLNNGNINDNGKSKSGGCFSAYMTVLVQTYPREEIRKVAMRDLRVGDRVLTRLDQQTGERIYEPIYAFGHRDSQALRSFYVITNKYNQHVKPLEITAHHLIYSANLNKPYPIPVHQLQADTDLLFYHQVAEEGTWRYYDADVMGWPIELVPMISINVAHRRGIYQPLTKSGTIVVNNILCSTHVNPIHPYNVNELQLESDLVESSRYYMYNEMYTSMPFNLDEFVLQDPLFIYLWMAPYRVVCTWGWYHLCHDSEEQVDHHKEQQQQEPLWWLKQSQYLANKIYHPEDLSLRLTSKYRLMVYLPILFVLVLFVGIEQLKSWPFANCILLGCFVYYSVVVFAEWQRQKNSKTTTTTTTTTTKTATTTAPEVEDVLIKLKHWREGKPTTTGTPTKEVSLPLKRPLRYEHPHVS